MKKSLYKVILCLLPATLVMISVISSCSKPSPAAVIAAAGLGSFNATVDGTAIAFVPSATKNNGIYSIIGSQSTAPIQLITINTNATGAGTYVLNAGISGSNGMYGTGPNTSTLTKYLTDSLNKGTLVITSMDTVKRVMSGNFNFKARQYQPTVSTATVTITSGTFSGVKW